jgi:hypothetical protein
VSFDVSPGAYLQFMGRYSEPLAAQFADLAEVRRGPLAAFWSAVRELDPAAPGEPDLAGVREGHLASLFTQAGLDRTQVSTLTARVRHASFDDWWRPFTLGAGPAGAYMASLTPDRRAALREQCRHLLPAAAVEVTAVGWAASGLA